MRHDDYICNRGMDCAMGGSGNKGSQRWWWLPQWWQQQWQVAAVVDTVDGKLLSWECDHIVQTALTFNPGGRGYYLFLFLEKCLRSTVPYHVIPCTEVRQLSEFSAINIRRRSYQKRFHLPCDTYTPKIGLRPP